MRCEEFVLVVDKELPVDIRLLHFFISANTFSSSRLVFSPDDGGGAAAQARGGPERRRAASGQVRRHR